MVYNFLSIDEKTEKSTYIRLEYLNSVSKQQPHDYASCIQVPFKLDFFIEANNMNPDQTVV